MIDKIMIRLDRWLDSVPNTVINSIVILAIAVIVLIALLGIAALSSYIIMWA